MRGTLTLAFVERGAEGNAARCSKIDLGCYPNYRRGMRGYGETRVVNNCDEKSMLNDMANRRSSSLDGARGAKAIGTLARGVFYHVLYCHL